MSNTNLIERAMPRALAGGVAFPRARAAKGGACGFGAAGAIGTPFAGRGSSLGWAPESVRPSTSDLYRSTDLQHLYDRFHPGSTSCSPPD